MKNIPHTKRRTGPQIKIDKIINNGKVIIPKRTFFNVSSNGNIISHRWLDIGTRMLSTVKEIAPTNALNINKIIGIVAATKTEEQTIPMIE